MLSIANRKAALRTIGFVCLAMVQAATPSAVMAQAAQGRTAPGGGAITAAPSGFLSSASGTVFVRRGTGPEVRAKVGDLFGFGITFRTGGESSAVLIFSDGQNVTLNTDSALRIDDYRFDVRDLKSSKATLGLLSGVMRLVTGAIHTDNRDGLFISAGNASIGISSKDVTAFVIEVDPKSLGVGETAVIVGEISIQTADGPIVTVASEQFSRWQPGAPPSAPIPLAAAPAFFQALVAASRATVLPSNGPLDIQSAAVQAALEALSPSGAGPPQPNVQAQAPEVAIAVIVPTVTPGGGRGCVGSPC